MNRKSQFRPARAAAGAVLLLLVGWLSGCEALFTTSLLSFLRRDPANLTADQQVAWAEQALASGDPVAMAEGYEVVKDDAANALLAARLALELSGVPVVMYDMLVNLETILGYDAVQMAAYLDGFAGSVNGTWAAAAGGHFEDALAADPGQLAGLDMVLGALCLAFDEADPGGFATLAVGGQTDSFLTACLAVLPADDPAFEILDLLQSII